MSTALGLVLLAVWLFAAVCQIREAMRLKSWHRLVTLVAATLLAIGAIGFFGSGLVAEGGSKWLPNSFEWPAGYCNGVVMTRDHYYIVPLAPVSRVQVYDRNWKFIRGWNVDAAGGMFKLFVTDTNHIHVVTARRMMHYEFDLKGELLSSTTYPDTGTGYSSFPSEGGSYVVPTPLLLWVFSSPFLSWLAAVMGIGLLIATDKKGRPK